MLNLFKSKQKKIEEKVEPVPMEIFDRMVGAVPILSPEEQRLKEAQAELEQLIAQDGSLDVETHTAEIEEAQQKINVIQKSIEQARKDKDARFHAANKKVLEAQADIQLAKQQKEVYEAISKILAGFKATDMGKNIPDDTAIILCLILETVPPNSDAYWTFSHFAHALVAVTDRIATYYAYKRRVGLA